MPTVYNLLIELLDFTKPQSQVLLMHKSLRGRRIWYDFWYEQ